ncbi:MAG: helix-turn-helix domain-containing protein [Acidobacteria bacterium]|nr:helix-turn-helix domain-containing protein [Acidobacteriota bacterium]
MAESLGEKLRRAREERGFSLSEVSEQTRISSLYLESIENDDYRILPGGIFNKGFVKSYAKFVGLNEQEALAEYGRIVARTEGGEDDPLKLYKPEVLTDDHHGRSMVPTVILAVVMLALMTAGLLWLVSYLRQPAAPATTNVTNRNANSAETANANTEPNISGVPDMSTVKVVFKTTTEAVSLTATKDGTPSSSLVAAGSSVEFEPKESLKLSYSKSLAQFVQLAINGRTIATPMTPTEGKKVIEFTISKDNLSQIWTSGSITGEPPASTDSNTANSTQPTAPKATPKPTGAESTNSAANKAKPANTAPAGTPKPPTSTPKPAANHE